MKTLNSRQYRYRVTLEMDVFATNRTEALALARREFPLGCDSDFCCAQMETVRLVDVNGGELFRPDPVRAALKSG